MILVSKTPRSVYKHWRPNLGILLAPRSGYSWDSIEEWAQQGGYWAMDNDAFSGFDEDAYLAMLDKFRHVSRGCLWVTAPDVVGNATETLIRFYEWYTVIHPYPVALVGQDGMTPGDVPWIEIDCLFIGGTTEWKLGLEARALVAEAKRQGKLVHMGRVNSRRRILYAKGLGCDSVDGTATVRYTDIKLPQYLEWAASPATSVIDFDAIEEDM